MTRRILVDADGCPVVAESIAAAQHFGITCLLLCDTAKKIRSGGGRLKGPPKRTAEQNKTFSLALHLLFHETEGKDP